ASVRSYPRSTRTRRTLDDLQPARDGPRCETAPTTQMGPCEPDRRMTMPPYGIVAVRAHLAKLPPTESVAERRAMYDRAERVFTLPPDTTVEPVTAGGRPAEWIRPAGARGDAALLYLHGGGYVIGSPRSHRHLAEALA